MGEICRLGSHGAQAVEVQRNLRQLKLIDPQHTIVQHVR